MKRNLNLLIIGLFLICIVHVQAQSEIYGNGSDESMALQVNIQDDFPEDNLDVMIVNVRSARVRESPSFDAPVEYGLLRGEKARILKTEGDWFYIAREDGKKGWGHKIIFESGKGKDDSSLRPEPFEEATGESEGSDSSIKNLSSSVNPKEEKTGTQGSGTGALSREIKGVKGPKATGSGVKWESDSRVSVNFLDVDIREALTAIALEKEINITSSQEVAGNITVHLYNLTLDRALDAITMAGGFTYTKKDDFYFVFKPKEEEDPQKEKLLMKIFRIKYTELDKVQEILTAIAGTRTVKIHEPTKTVIVEETPENMKKIESIIAQWDQKPKQVMIEAKIMEINLTDDMSFGVNWSKILGDVRIGTGSFSSAALPSSSSEYPVPSGGTGIFANMITASGTGRQFSAAIDALRSKTKINILSTPKILAIHGKPAKVQVGGQQGYSVTTVNEGVSTESIEFIDTGTILDITPFIDDDNTVLLDVKPSIRSARIEEGIPVVNSTEVSTWLTARDGETLFIGGLIQDTSTKTRESVPCLGGIPGLGAAFGRSVKETGKTELVIMITPNIIKQSPGDKDHETISRVRDIERTLGKKNLPAEDLKDFLLFTGEQAGVTENMNKDER